MNLEFIVLLIFSIIASCIIWFFAFKIRLLWDRKRLVKDIDKKLEKKSFIMDGKEVEFEEEIKKEVIGNSPVMPEAEESINKTSAPGDVIKEKEPIKPKPILKKLPTFGVKQEVKE